MAVYKSRFIEIDPDNCSKEELYNAIKECKDLSGYYETKQLAVKTFINSVYGACASKFFVGHNTAVAESITLQGQDLNHYSENCVNKYFRGIFQSLEEYNKVIYVPLFEWMEKYDIETTDEFYAKTPDKQWVLVKLPVSKDVIKSGNIDKEIKAILKKVSVKTTFGEYLGEPYEKIKEFEINKGKLTQNEPLNSLALKAKNPLNSKENPFAYMGKTTYLEDDPTCSLTIAGDTDSCEYCTEIYLNCDKMTIENAFNISKCQNNHVVLKLQNGQEIIPVKNYTTKTVDPNTLEIIDRPIKYIMRHKVSKAKFKIVSETGKEIIVTGDHSCMVYRNNELISIKAKDINPETDKLVEIDN